MRWLHATIVVAMVSAAVPVLAAPAKVAVLDFQLVDTSLEGEINGINPAETVRLGILAPRLRSAIASEPGFTGLDVGPSVAAAQLGQLDNCKRCIADLGQKLGADIIIIGTVQKVSNLILNINAQAHDIRIGKVVAGGSADIRGNNDEMWNRGIDALWRNTLKRQFDAIAVRQGAD